MMKSTRIQLTKAPTRHKGQSVKEKIVQQVKTEGERKYTPYLRDIFFPKVKNLFE